jgi:hypothetical protein
MNSSIASTERTYDTNEYDSDERDFEGLTNIRNDHSNKE